MTGEKSPFVQVNSVRNHLLNALPSEEWHRIAGYFKRTPLKARRVLHHWNMPMQQVYFVETGLVSVMARADSTSAIEVWIVGREGMSGIPVVLGGEASPPHRRVVLMGGAALQISAGDLRQAMAESSTFHALLLRYVQVVLTQTSQLAACNARHSVQKRLVRWLLMAQARLGDGDLSLTHDTLSNLLGVRRASVTNAMTALHNMGWIDTTRGRIRLLDFAQLEAAACNCHQMISGEYERTLRGWIQQKTLGEADRAKSLVPPE